MSRDNQTFVKVLVDGHACHGGTYEYDLPHPDWEGGWIPGAWTPDRRPVLCKSGWHVTRYPYRDWAILGMTCYAVEMRGDRSEEQNDKVACESIRLTRPLDHPRWWQDAVEFVDSIANTAFFRPREKPDPSWRMFPTRNAAIAATNTDGYIVGDYNINDKADHNAAYNAICNAAIAAAYNAIHKAINGTSYSKAHVAANAAEFVASSLIHQDDPTYARKRWAVWEAGYGLYADINGTFYVYERP